MATLQPRLSGGVGFEQPVTTPSLLSGIADLANIAVKAQGKPRQPTESERQGAALQPYSKRLNQIFNSSLSDQDKIREGRKLTREFITTTPQYADEAWGVAGGFGIEKPEALIDPVDLQTAAVADWAQNDPEGQAALIEATVLDGDGQVDMEATMMNLGASFQQTQADKAEHARVKREMDIASADVGLHKAKSQSRISELVPQWTQKTTKRVNSLASLALSSPELDEPHEQLQFLRRARTELFNSFQAGAQAEGLHVSVYSGEGESNIIAALKPIDTLIEQFQGDAKDIETRLGALRNAAEADALESALDVFGPVAANPEFQKQMFAAGQHVYEKDAVEYYKGVKDMQRTAGPSLFGAPIEDIQRNMETLSNTGEVDKKSVVSAAGTTLSNLDTSDQSSAAPTAQLGYKMLQATGSRLGVGALERIFNPNAIGKVTEIIQRGDSFSEGVKDQLLAFTANQTRMNGDYLQDLIAGSNPNDTYTVFKDGNNVLHLLKNGGRLDSASAPSEKEMLKTIQAMNKTNRSVTRILGLEGKPVSEVIPMEPMGNQQEILDYLNTLSGEDDIQGSSGTDDLSSVGQTTSRLHGLVDRTEGGGGYDTLFSFSNREGGQFSSISVSQMSIGELKDFADGPYGEWSKGQLGYKATPMGRYQIVGTTLSQTAKEMGLHDNIVFTPEVQDAMFHHLAKKAISGKTSAAGKREALRGTWEGFKSVSDAELDAAIADFEGRPVPSYTELQKETKVSGLRPMLRRPEQGPSLPFEAQEPATQFVGGGVQELQQPQVTQVAEVREEAPETGSEGAQRTADEVTDLLSSATRNLLNRLGVDPEDVPVFESEDDVRRALQNGDVKQGDVIILNGQVIPL